jgi:hypothetical protein
VTLVGVSLFLLIGCGVAGLLAGGAGGVLFGLGIAAFSIALAVLLQGASEPLPSGRTLTSGESRVIRRGCFLSVALGSAVLVVGLATGGGGPVFIGVGVVAGVSAIATGATALFIAVRA